MTPLTPVTHTTYRVSEQDYHEIITSRRTFITSFQDNVVIDDFIYIAETIDDALTYRKLLAKITCIERRNICPTIIGFSVWIT